MVEPALRPPGRKLLRPRGLGGALRISAEAPQLSPLSDRLRKKRTCDARFTVQFHST